MDEVKLSKIPGIQRNVSLAKYSTFHVGGPAKYFVAPTNRKNLAKAFRIAHEEDVPYYILGGGSNILISDKGFNGLIIKPSNIGIAIDGEHVSVEAGTPLQQFVQKAQEAGLSGVEHVVGIPGSVGGAVAGNAGTAKEWIEQTLITVSIARKDGELVNLPKSQCGFSYRYSRFKNSHTELIVGADFSLTRADPEVVRKKALQYIEKRKQQPSGDACAGCTFKNPQQAPAGKLIDDAGLKGKKIGGAKVSEEHGNFLVNTGNATAEDIVILISYIKQQVRDQLGVQLQEEINYVGFE